MTYPISVVLLDLFSSLLHAGID